MGKITKIEEKLAAFVERPFRAKNSLDFVGIEIALKRLIEAQKKNILGKILVPNHFSIYLDKKFYSEYEPFFDKFKSTLQKSLLPWIKEKGYDIISELEIDFKEGSSNKRAFEAITSFKKDNSVSQDKKEQIITGENDTTVTSNSIVGELLNKKTGERFTIYNIGALIGRGEDCTVRLDDPTVSEKHTLLSYQYGKVILEDLGSRNGTRANNEKIKKKVLKSGDMVILGETELILEKVEL